MKIGITNGAYSKFRNQCFEKMKDHGYNYTDYGLTKQSHPIYKGEDYRAVLSEDKMLMEQVGITPSQTHGPWDYHPKGDSVQEIAQTHKNMKICIEATAFLGAKYMVVHPFFPHGEFEDPTPEEDLNLNVKLFKELAPIAEQYGVVICIENLPWRIASNGYPARILELIKAIDHPNFAACLDTGHSMSCGVQPADAVRILGSYIKVTHIHDNQGGGDQHKFPYDEGCVIDWKAFSTAMKEIGYEGVFSLETSMKAELDLPEFELDCKKLAGIILQIAKAAE